MQTPQVHEGSKQNMAHSELNKMPGPNTQPRNPHRHYESNTWHAPRRLAFNPNLVNAAGMPSMNGIPQYVAMQEMAFRQGQLDHEGPHDVPPNPFPKQFYHVWVEYYKLGLAYGKAPAASPTATSPTFRENYAWPVLTNPATQDFEHPNGTFDAKWSRQICIMSLNGMKELIRLVCRRPTDWRKIVCDIPRPIKHAIVAFPDLYEYYMVLQHDACEALNGQHPFGY